MKFFITTKVIWAENLDSLHENYVEKLKNLNNCKNDKYLYENIRYFNNE